MRSRMGSSSAQKKHDAQKRGDYISMRKTKKRKKI